MKRRLFAIAACMMFLLPMQTAAQDWPDGVGLRQIFQIEVVGTGRAGNEINLSGTGFAIAPDMIVTAGHVTLREGNYRNLGESSIVVPDRTVTAEFVERLERIGQPESIREINVSPSPIETVDAARLNFGGVDVRPFKLSACQIGENTVYNVLKFKDGDPWSPIRVPITLEAYGRSELGDVGDRVVMRKVDATRQIVNGDSGSPVLVEDDETGETRVIGLVSAVHEHEVHVTLVNAFLGLIPHDIKDITCTDRALGDEIADLRRKIAVLEEDNQALRGMALGLTNSHLRLIQQVEELSELGQTTLSELEELDKGTASDLLQITTAMNQIVGDIPADMDPLRPTVVRMNNDLLEPSWTLSGVIDENGDAKITLAYDRRVSDKPYSDVMLFCMKPLFPVDPAVATGTRNPATRFFYERYEPQDGGETIDIRGCKRVSHNVVDANKPERDGFYLMPFDKNTVEAVRQVWQDSRAGNVGPWDGRYYLRILEPRTGPDGSTTGYDILFRAIVDTTFDEDEGYRSGSLPCVVYDNSADFADFMEKSLPLSQEATCYSDL